MPTKEEIKNIELGKEQEWRCYYCNEGFDSLFNRDMHHREHPEHYKYLFYNCMEMIHELETEIEDLKQQIEAFSKTKKSSN